MMFLMAHMRWKRIDKFFGKARKVFIVDALHEDPPLDGSRHGPVVYRFAMGRWFTGSPPRSSMARSY
jgi:protein N-lysine methyltransferase METTL21C